MSWRASLKPDGDIMPAEDGRKAKRIVSIYGVLLL